MFPLRDEINPPVDDWGKWPAWKAPPAPVAEPDPKDEGLDDTPQRLTPSHARYKLRIQDFKADGRPWPRVRHHALWLLHNCVAHPLLALATPGYYGGRSHMLSGPAVELHEMTSQWLNKVPAHADGFRSRRITGVRPVVQKRGAWILHNLVAHVAIGLLPCAATFRFHDATAKRMGVPGWV